MISTIRRRPWRVAAVVFVIASVYVWRASAAQDRAAERAVGEELFAGLSSVPGGTAEDARTLVRLVGASREARLGFLSAALRNEPSAQRLRLHEHALAVALSQVSRDEARALYEGELLAALNREPEVMEAAFALMRRWNIAEAVEQSAASKLSSNLVERANDADNRRTLEALCDGIATLATRAEPDPKLVRLVASEPDSNRTILLASAAVGQVSRLRGESAAEAARLLGERMAEERDVSTLQAVARLVERLQLDAATLDRMAQRAQSEQDVDALAALLKAAPKTASRLSGRMRAGERPGVLLLLARATPDSDASVIAASLVNAAHPLDLATLAFALGAVHPAPGLVDQAADRLTRSLETEQEPYALAALGAGLGALGPAPHAAQSATRLAARISRESDPAILVRLAIALHAVANGWSREEADRFAAQAVARMTTSRGHATLRLLAFELHAVKERTSSEPFASAAKLLLERLEGETDPKALENLAMGLRLLEGPVDEGVFARATRYLAIDPDEALVVLRPFSPPEPYEAAAATLVNQMAEERDPAVLGEQAALLGGLDVESLTPADLSRLDHVFEVPTAPCEVLASVRPEDRRGAVIRQLRNPLCSESSWKRLALLIRAAQENTEEEEPSLEALAGVEDDDGERSEGELDPITLDFNTVSDALPALPQAASTFPAASPWLLLAAVAALVIERVAARKS